jgi:hypothetical protein
LLSSKDKDKFDRIYGVGPDGYRPRPVEEVKIEEPVKEATPQKPKEERKKNMGMIGGPDELEQESVVEDPSPEAQESPEKIDDFETQEVQQPNVSDDEDEDEVAGDQEDTQ